jgi:hypothetical protein
MYLPVVLHLTNLFVFETCCIWPSYSSECSLHKWKFSFVLSFFFFFWRHIHSFFFCPGKFWFLQREKVFEIFFLMFCFKNIKNIDIRKKKNSKKWLLQFFFFQDKKKSIYQQNGFSQREQIFEFFFFTFCLKNVIKMDNRKFFFEKNDFHQKKKIQDRFFRELSFYIFSSWFRHFSLKVHFLFFPVRKTII